MGRETDRRVGVNETDVLDPKKDVDTRVHPRTRSNGTRILITWPSKAVKVARPAPILLYVERTNRQRRSAIYNAIGM